MTKETMTTGTIATIKQIALDKSDFPAGIGMTATGTIWGLTQSEVAALMTIGIGLTIMAHKIVLIYIALNEHRIKIRDNSEA